jgi:hypothetical protein
MTGISTADLNDALDLVIYIFGRVFQSLDSYYIGDYSLLDYFLGFTIIFTTLAFFNRLNGVILTGVYSDARERRKNNRSNDKGGSDNE